MTRYIVAAAAAFALVLPSVIAPAPVQAQSSGGKWDDAREKRRVADRRGRDRMQQAKRNRAGGTNKMAGKPRGNYRAADQRGASRFR